MNNYLFENGIYRLKLLNQNFEEKEWFHNIVQELEREKFLTMNFKQTLEIKDFNPSHIVGTYHCDYYNLTWIEILGSLKRFNINVINNNNKSLKSYINNRNGIRLAKYDSNYYILEGNHRFCIAKFMNLTIDEVTIDEFEI